MLELNHPAFPNVPELHTESVVTPRMPDASTVWVDLLAPSESERRLVESVTGLRVPTLADLTEIETSSRLNLEGDALYLSLPLAVASPDGSRSTPFGFVLTAERVITVHFQALHLLDLAMQRLERATVPERGSGLVFTTLLEVMVDHFADVLEAKAALLDKLSHGIFREPQPRSRTGYTDQRLRAALRTIGRAVEALGRIREALLGIARIVPFAIANTRTWLAPDVRNRLDVVRGDVGSLTEQVGHLTAQVQFLQDATLGFIGIEQSNIIRILTVVSVVGVPPTLVASIYGMNFKIIPELEWAFGYPYALALIVISAVLPLVWFRRNGWL